MKDIKIFKNLSILLFLSISSLGFSQVINKPGETTVVDFGETLVKENLLGSYTATFSGVNGDNVPPLIREETNASGSGIGSYDELETLYSGRIYSRTPQGEEQTFVQFQDKTPEQLSRMEVEINSENGGSGLPPNIRGIIASRLAQLQQEFSPEIMVQILQRIMHRIAQIPKEGCASYFEKVLQEVDNVHSTPPGFQQEIYNRIVEEITALQNEICGGAEYSLFLHLEAKVTSKPMDHELSDDAGNYRSLVRVDLTPLNQTSE